jgi:hypothetical protein
MDGSSGINILYDDTLDCKKIPRSHLHLSGTPFYGIILGMQAEPLRIIQLPFMLVNPSNFRKELLTFKAPIMHCWAAMLCKVYGHPTLHLFGNQDSQAS